VCIMYSIAKVYVFALCSKPRGEESLCLSQEALLEFLAVWLCFGSLVSMGAPAVSASHHRPLVMHTLSARRHKFVWLESAWGMHALRIDIVLVP
jgi:hypothetical protein